MFFVLYNTDIASYTDDTTPHTSASSVVDLVRILEEISNKLFHWFALSQMRANKKPLGLENFLLVVFS